MIEGRLKSIRVKLKEKLDRTWIRAALTFVPFVGYGLVSIYYQVEDFRNAVNTHLLPGLANFLKVYVLPINLFALAIAFCLTYISTWLDTRRWDSAELDSDVLSAINSAFETVVRHKHKRFVDEYKKYTKSGTFPRPGVIFKTITQPEQQIALLSAALREFFNRTTKDINFRVRVIALDNNVPVDWFCCIPENRPPRTSMATLCDPNSAVSHCLNKGGMEIIEDIQKAAKFKNPRYVLSRPSATDETGSLICFPIPDVANGCYAFVVTVSADRTYFRKSDSDYYDWVIEQFAIRFQLEHCLLLLKK